MSNFNDGDQPVGAPTKGAATPWTYQLEYKSGKTASGYADVATPEKSKAGLSYYDKEASERIYVDREFTCCIVAVLSGISGTVKDARDNYTNYSSNLVQDTRSDILNVWMRGIPKPILKGKYMDIKPNLPEGVGYTRYLICWVPELNQLVSLELTVGLGIAVEKAIAEICGKKPKDISLFNLCELAQFWVLKISHEFDKMDKDGNDYAGNGDMYFIPKIRAYVITETGNNPDGYAFLKEQSESVSEYLIAKQTRIKSFGDETAPDDEQTIPTTPPPNMEDNTRSVADDIPDTTPPPPSPKEVFYAKLQGRLNDLTDPATVVTGIQMLYASMKNVKLSDYDTNIDELSQTFSKHYWKITNDMTGRFEGGKIVTGDGVDITDLPF